MKRNYYARSLSLLLSIATLLTVTAGCSSSKSAQAPAAAQASSTSAAESKASAAADTGKLPAADVAEQGYDHYDKAVTYQEAESKLGPMPKISKDLKIGYVCKTFENEFWRMQKEGAEEAAKKLNAAGYKVTMEVRAAQQESDEQGQLAILSDMVNKKYDGILLSPISDGNLVPGIEEAVKSNIQMTVVMDAFVPNVDNTVGAWHYHAGEQAAEWISKKSGGKGEVAIIQGLPKSPAARERTNGFKAWFEKNNPEMKIVAVQNADWDRMKSKEIADIWMKQYPDLKGIYANNDTMAMGALESIKTANKVGKCLIVGTDGTSEAIKSIKAGELDASINFYPYYMAQIGTEMLIRKLGGQTVPKVIYAPQGVVEKSNADKNPEEVIGWKGYNFEK